MRLMTVLMPILASAMPLAALQAEASAESGTDPGDMASVPAGDNHEATIAAFENGLRRSYGVVGEPAQTWTLAERMRHYNVPGVSIAVAIDGRLAWAKAYGVADSGSGREVDTDTLFQAASLSKPVASLAALALVQEGRLELDAPVNRFLTRWQVPDNRFTRQQPVTVRHLLSHRAGMTVHGFRGYRDGEELPALAQILAGADPANTPPVVVDRLPGAGYRYSGGGFTALQLAIEDVTRTNYADFVDDRIFHPAGLSRSNFSYPASDPNIAIGHRGDASRSMRDAMLRYPELAAAGLWTTPSELVRLGSLVAQARHAGNFLLDPALAQGLVPDSADDAGLGFGLNDDGDGVAFVHSGHNPGYSARWINYADGRASVAVLTNSDSGGELIREILSAIGHLYGWKQDGFRERHVAELSQQQLAGIAGQYAFDAASGDPLLTIRLEGDELWAEGEFFERARLYPETATGWFVTKGLNFEGEPDASGTIVALTIQDEIRLVRVNPR